MVTAGLLIFYIIFGRVLPWSLAVTIALIFGRQSKSWLKIGLLFGIGLLEDIAHLNSLGLGSVGLVTLMVITWFIESQYRSRILWWWYGLGLLGELFFRFIEGQPITIVALLAQVFALGVFRWLSMRLVGAEGIYVGR